MATPECHLKVPTAFVSYSWDDDAHREWVKHLATRLRTDGVDVTLDRWHSAPGDQIPAFMERAVRENDFVLAVCTPRFKERSDERDGGIGYEGDIMTAYAFTGGDKRKFIPVLRRGSWKVAAPTWLLGRANIDLSGDPYSESEYQELLRTLHCAREGPPPVGPRPNFEDNKGSGVSLARALETPFAGSSKPQHQSSITPQENNDDARQPNAAASVRTPLEPMPGAIAGNAPRYPKIFQAPPLPAHYVPRPEVIRGLKALLIGDNPAQPGVLVGTAVHGMGGIGKSTIAAALAHDPEVNARFSDGVFWVTLGQQPDPLSVLSLWVQVLSDTNIQPLGVSAATSWLRSLLQSRKALIVIDDAFQAEHVRPFLIGGPDCRLLITSRDTQPAEVLHFSAYNLDLMTPGQSISLLGNRLGHPIAEVEYTEAADLARTVGFLPLALELAAAQVADGIPWSALLRDLQAEVARLEALRRPGSEEVSDDASRRMLSLLGSFAVSFRRLNDEMRNSFAWLGVLREDIPLTPAVAARLWETDENSARSTLVYLRQKALLLPGPDPAANVATFRVHDLLHDMARRLLTSPKDPKTPDELPGLGLTISAAHRTLLARYRRRTGRGHWHTLPDDGYLYTHLIWHLEQSGSFGDIHVLLGESLPDGTNGWYQARQTAGQLAGYLEDVHRAWRIAEKQHEEDSLDQSIGLQFRYALILMSLNSLASRIRPSLLAAVVAKEVWPPEQALTYVEQIPDRSLRAESIALLAPRLPTRLMQRALSVASMIEESNSKARALAAVAEHLPASHVYGALQAEVDRAFSVVDEIDELARVTRLREKPQISDKQAREAAQAARLAIDVAERNRTDQMKKALREFAQLDEIVRAHALTTLILRASHRWIIELLAESQKMNDDVAKAMLLIALVPKLPEPSVTRALRIAQSIESDQRRKQCIDFIYGYLPKDELVKLLSSSMAIGDGANRKELLSSLCRSLNDARVSDHASLGRLTLLGELVRLKCTLVVRRMSRLPSDVRNFCIAIAKMVFLLGFVLFSVLCIFFATETILYFVEPGSSLRDLARMTWRRTFLWCVVGIVYLKLISILGDRILKKAREDRLERSSTIAPDRTTLYSNEITSSIKLRVTSILECLFRAKYPDSEILLRLKNAVQRGSDERDQAMSAIEQSLSLDRSLLYRAYAITRTIPDVAARDMALAALSSVISDSPGESLYAEWCRTLRTLSQGTRENFINKRNVKQYLSLQIEALGGEDGLREAATALEDVGVWWP